jgi:ubiquinone/menaquinone biosynthesis C-methylase UbiE
MHKAEFDKFADEYHSLHQKNIRLSGEGAEFFAEYKIRDIFELLTNRADNQDPQQILDFGAGIGTAIPNLLRFFPDATLTCLDVSEKSIEVGRSRFPGFADFQSFDGKCIPFPDNIFDQVFATFVFQYIPNSANFGLLSEWFRVKKLRGTTIIFEHNPLYPLTVNVVNTCSSDKNAELIPGILLRKEMQRTGFQKVGLRYKLFLPRAQRVLLLLITLVALESFGCSIFRSRDQEVGELI